MARKVSVYSFRQTRHDIQNPCRGTISNVVDLESTPLVFIRHPRARRYVIRVRPDGSVRVTLPRWGSRRQAELFAEEQRHWIERQRRRIVEQGSQGVGGTPEALKELHDRAAHELPDRLRGLAAHHGLTVARISIRNQQSRWGSCSPHGHICLNWRLVLMPDFVRDYVLIHELMHLKRLDHSPRFWKLVAAACADYKEARVWLRRNKQLLSPQGGYY